MFTHFYDRRIFVFSLAPHHTQVTYAELILVWILHNHSSLESQKKMQKYFEQFHINLKTYACCTCLQIYPIYLGRGAEMHLARITAIKFETITNHQLSFIKTSLVIPRMFQDICMWLILPSTYEGSTVYSDVSALLVPAMISRPAWDKNIFHIQGTARHLKAVTSVNSKRCIAP